MPPKTVAADVFVLLQLPPVPVVVNVVPEPAHTDEAPEMLPALGKGLTVNDWVA